MPFFTTYPRSQRSALGLALLKLPLAALLPALISVGCGSDSDSERATASCVPGRTEACACTDGRLRAQQCLASSSFGPCECSRTAGPDAGAGEKRPENAEAGVEAGATSDGAGGADPAVREFCDRTIHAFADKAASCCSEADRATALFASLDGDRRAMATECEPMISKGIASGRISFHADRAAACSAALGAKVAGLACRSPEVRAPAYWDATCDGVIVGLQDVDQPCRRPSECRPGLACVGYDANAEGSCRALPGGGDPCSRGASGVMAFPFDIALPQCAANLRCTRGAEDPTPKCYPLRSIGEKCDSNARDCKPELQCKSSFCAPYPDVGEACAASPFSCSPGFTCNAARQCAEGVEGAPCSFDTQCSGRCVSGGNFEGNCRAFCGSR